MGLLGSESWEVRHVRGLRTAGPFPCPEFVYVHEALVSIEEEKHCPWHSSGGGRCSVRYLWYIADGTVRSLRVANRLTPSFGRQQPSITTGRQLIIDRYRGTTTRPRSPSPIQATDIHSGPSGRSSVPATCIRA